ncbi:MAG: AmmeMemoRadiSam system protein B [Planctomycetota bacterium]|jgi:AmmeMemoRadiSam system protein B
MKIRKPAVAGQFYGGSQAECLAEISECLTDKALMADLPDPIVAAVVPHAGWVFSGELAARAFHAIRQVNETVDTFVIFGAAHRYCGTVPAVYPDGAWQTPLGEVQIDSDLATEIAKLDCVTDRDAHTAEHSIEVQVPFIQHLFPDARIVPVIVPAGGFDLGFGTGVGELIANTPDKKIVCIASTDLTHYGPSYGFCPEGVGEAAIKWARDVNDVEFIDLALSMETDKIILEAHDNCSACGPGAVAVTVAAAKALGRTGGILLGHTTSHDILLEKFNQSSNESVGYAAIVF